MDTSIPTGPPPTAGQPALHHLAFACRDLEETHAFYRGVLGLPLVHAEVTEMRGGYLKHVFYDLGDRMLLTVFSAGKPDKTKD